MAPPIPTTSLSARTHLFKQLGRKVKLVFTGWVLLDLIIGWMMVRDLNGVDLNPSLDGGETLIIALIATVLVCFSWLVPLGMYFRRSFVRPIALTLSGLWGLIFVAYIASNARYLVLVEYDWIPAAACFLGFIALGFSALSMQIALRLWPGWAPASLGVANQTSPDL